MSTTYRWKFLLASLFLAGAIASALRNDAGIATFCGAAAGALVMDGIWSGWWKAYKTVHDIEEGA